MLAASSTVTPVPPVPPMAYDPPPPQFWSELPPELKSSVVQSPYFALAVQHLLSVGGGWPSYMVQSPKIEPGLIPTEQPSASSSSLFLSETSSAASTNRSDSCTSHTSSEKSIPELSNQKISVDRTAQDGPSDYQPQSVSQKMVEQVNKACKRGRLQELKKLLAQDHTQVLTAIQVEHNGKTALHRAARAGHSEVVQFLLRCGADVDQTDYKNRAAVHYAIYHDHLPMLIALAESGADLRVVDEKQQNLLHLAARYNRVTTMQELLKREPDLIEQPDLTGQTALHQAILHEQKPALRCLLNSPDVKHSLNIQEKISGQTVLHAAAEMGESTTVSTLLKAGSNPLLRDHDGKTAFNLALDQGHYKSAAILLWHRVFPTRAESNARPVSPSEGEVDLESGLAAPVHLYPIQQPNLPPKIVHSTNFVLGGVEERLLKANERVLPVDHIAVIPPRKASAETTETAVNVLPLPPRRFVLQRLA